MAREIKASSVSDLVGKAKKYNPRLGNYVEHMTGQDFKVVVILDNGIAVKINRSLAIGYSHEKSILTKDHLIEIANSAYRYE
ncbi:hypothetical protein [Chryseobacterium cucumeris]|uniref:hypothetical protein n=1 Tax=Chryseobacterium cucumeris TaxID=1813611 RepID=UPI002457074A|nr:hypothetical protein [Chryseobacterium cucumeris]MDH5032438.1 hypothetical protein [Chryseobacterium cucumeris]